MLMAEKIVSEEEKDKFLADCAEAEKDLENREREVEKVCDICARNLQLVGATAVEDRL